MHFSGGTNQVEVSNGKEGREISFDYLRKIISIQILKIQRYYL